MDRRTLLRSAGVGLLGGAAGCLSVAAGDRSTDVVQRISQPSVPDRYDTTIVVSKLSGVTEKRTATLEILIRNDRDTERTYVGGSSFPFVGTSTPNGLILLDHARNDGDDADACWSVDKSVWPLNATATQLAGGEAVRPQFGVWDDGAVDGCFTPGEYRFEDTMLVDDPDGSESVFEWGFTVTVGP